MQKKRRNPILLRINYFVTEADLNVKIKLIFSFSFFYFLNIRRCLGDGRFLLPYHYFHWLHFHDKLEKHILPWQAPPDPHFGVLNFSSILEIYGYQVENMRGSYGEHHLSKYSIQFHIPFLMAAYNNTASEFEGVVRKEQDRRLQRSLIKTNIQI